MTGDSINDNDTNNGKAQVDHKQTISIDKKIIASQSINARVINVQLTRVNRRSELGKEQKRALFMFLKWLSGISTHANSVQKFSTLKSFSQQLHFNSQK